VGIVATTDTSLPETGTASEYLAGMSHDLRTPLNAIIGMAELLKDGLVGDLSPDQADCVRDIWNSGRNLLAMIEDMLDVARLDSGRAMLHAGECDLTALLGDCIRQAQELGLPKGIDLNAAIDPRLATGMVDSRQLKKTILTLAAYAIAASPQGGRVDLAFSRTDAGDIGCLPDGMPGHTVRFDGDAHGFFLKITCRDIGTPLDTAQAKRLFDRIDNPGDRRAPVNTPSRPGLALARMLARLQRGAVAAAGAQVCAWVPLPPSPAQLSASSSSITSAAIP